MDEFCYYFNLYSLLFMELPSQYQILDEAVYYGFDEGQLLEWIRCRRIFQMSQLVRSRWCIYLFLEGRGWECQIEGYSNYFLGKRSKESLLGTSSTSKMSLDGGEFYFFRLVVIDQTCFIVSLKTLLGRRSRSLRKNLTIKSEINQNSNLWSKFCNFNVNCLNYLSSSIYLLFSQLKNLRLLILNMSMYFSFRFCGPNFIFLPNDSDRDFQSLLIVEQVSFGSCFMNYFYYYYDHFVQKQSSGEAKLTVHFFLDLFAKEGGDE